MRVSSTLHPEAASVLGSSEVGGISRTPALLARNERILRCFSMVTTRPLDKSSAEMGHLAQSSMDAVQFAKLRV